MRKDNERNVFMEGKIDDKTWKQLHDKGSLRQDRSVQRANYAKHTARKPR